MPVTVTLDFIVPETEGIVALHVYESSAQGGPFTQIDVTTDVGTFPSYITKYTTHLANSRTDWFTIAWEDSNGLLPASQPVQGNLPLGELVDRVLTNDPSLNEELVLQEAEAVMEWYFGKDPYSVTWDDFGDRKYQIMQGLTYLILARMYVSEILTGTNVSSYTAGIVAQQSGSSSSKSLDNVKSLIELSNLLLGRNLSLVMQLDPVDYGTFHAAEVDQSRLLIELL